MEELGPRKAEFVDMHQEGDGRVRVKLPYPNQGYFRFETGFAYAYQREPQ